MRRLTLNQRVEVKQAQSKTCKFRGPGPMKVAFNTVDRYCSYVVVTKHGFVSRPGIIGQWTITRNQSDAVLFFLSGAKRIATEMNGSVYRMHPMGAITPVVVAKYDGDEYDYV